MTSPHPQQHGRASRSDRGAAAVELAILLPLLLLVVFGIVDFGRMLNAQITLTEAAREGARAEALDSDPHARIDAASEGLGAGDADPCGTDGNKVCRTVQECSVDNPDAVVTTSYTFQFATPLGGISQLFGGTTGDGDVTLTGKGVMPCMGSTTDASS